MILTYCVHRRPRSTAPRWRQRSPTRVAGAGRVGTKMRVAAAWQGDKKTVQQDLGELRSDELIGMDVQLKEECWHRWALASTGAVKGATRTKVQTEGRVTGTLTEWKGSFGWTEPNEPVDQPDAGKSGDASTLRTKAEMSGVGAEVTFLLYTNGRGLGAIQLSQQVAQVPGSRLRRSHQATVAKASARAS